MRRVLHIIDHMGPGGAQQMVKFFLRQQTPYEHHAYALRRVKHDEFSHPKFSRSESGSLFSLNRLFHLKKLIKEKEISVLHLHLNNAVAYTLVLQKFLGVRQPLVVHEHGEVFRKDFAGKLTRLFYRWLSKTSFVAVSEDVEQKLEQGGFQDATLLKNMPFRFYGEVPEGENIPVDKIDTRIFKVGFIGRISKRKNWRGYLKVAKQLAGQGDIQFVIAGDGPERKTMLKEINNNGLRRVGYLGHVQNMRCLYHELDCVLLLSEWEGAALVQCEALSSGVPVVMYRNPGMRQWGNDQYGTLTANNGDVKEVARKVLWLKNNPLEYAKLRKNAQGVFSEETPNRYLSRLNTLYQEVLNGTV